MEFTTYNACTIRGTMSDLATAIINHKPMQQQVTVDGGAKTPLFETALKGPAVTTDMETASSFIELEMAAHTVGKAS